MTRAHDTLAPFFGDLHSHCAVGYGHGSLEDAFRNARLQLDFACVTVHAAWPDIPREDARLASVVDYHETGFARAAAAWPDVQRTVDANHAPGEFVSFLGFEWHSRAYGDHNVYFSGAEGEIIRGADLEDMRRALRAYRARGVDALLIPHHIGYRRGSRGINWSAFTPEFSPIVEIMSMHGASESADAPYPYLHTMGPRDRRSLWQYGLAQGHVVGVMGSTDHHSGHPGSYGHGRLCVWAEELTRAALWQAIRARRTVALTGDNIRLWFTLDGEPVGSVLSPRPRRHLAVQVEGGDALDYVEVLHNNRVVHRWTLPDAEPAPDEPVKLTVEVGWGEKHERVLWDARLSVEGGRLESVEPRFRGHEIVEPQAGDEESYAFSAWQRPAPNEVAFQTRTWGNLTTTTSSTQGLCLTLLPGPVTRLRGTINGVAVAADLDDLRAGPLAGYLGGFLTPAYAFGRAVPRSAYAGAFALVHDEPGPGRDWYYVRVRQTNGQYAWSSPIWVEAAPG